MSFGSAPHSTIWFLFSPFLKARVLSALAAAFWTFFSCDSNRLTRGGMPFAFRTIVLMRLFSCAKFVIASDARLATLAFAAFFALGWYRCKSGINCSIPFLPSIRKELAIRS